MKRAFVLLLALVLVFALAAPVLAEEANPFGGVISFEYDTAVGELLGDVAVYRAIGALKVGVEWPFLQETATQPLRNTYQLFAELELDQGLNLYAKNIRFDNLEPTVGISLEF